MSVMLVLRIFVSAATTIQASTSCTAFEHDSSTCVLWHLKDKAGPKSGRPFCCVIQLGQANASGDLNFFFIDSDAYNNVGAVTADVNAVPEPATLGLMGLGLLALARRRRA